MLIKKESFVKAIEDIKTAWKFTDEMNSFLKKSGGNGYVILPDCTDTCLRILHETFGKADADDWISYFCCDLDFGAKWKPDTIKDADGAFIKLETAEDLYDLLIRIRLKIEGC